jgi:hypothetical protein
MTFLAPSLLLLGLAATVPVVLHLLQRHPGPRMQFPALRYLRRAERERSSRLRLRQVLLLALRILALVLLASAAARPVLSTGGRGHHPTAVVLVLDNSLASGAVHGDELVLDRYRSAALATLAQADSDDRLWLIRAGEPWEPAVRADADALAGAIRAVQPVATSADLMAQLERAASILAAEGGDRAREIHVLSPLAASAFRSVPGVNGEPGTGADDPADRGARVLVLDLELDEYLNRALVAVEVGGGLPPVTGERTAVSATVVARATSQPLDVRLVVDGRVLSAGSALPGSAATLWLPPSPVGLVAGHVEIDPDAQAADDRRYFVTEVRPPVTVRLSAPAPYVEEALAVLEEANRLRRQTGRAEVVVAPGGMGVEAIREGAAVLILPPTSPLELAAVNRRLTDAGVPWHLRAPAPGGGRLMLEEPELGAILEDARLHQVYGLERVGEGADSVLVRLQSGEPWAVAGATDGGRYLLLGTPLTAEAGTIPTSHAMLPFLDRAINGWARVAPVHREHSPGEVVQLPIADSVLRPDGKADRLASVRSYRVTAPGIHRVFAGDEVVTAVAVNAPPAASDPRRATPSDVAALAPRHDVRAVGERGWDGAIFHRRLGREITGVLPGEAVEVANLPGALPAALVATLIEDLHRRLWIVVADGPAEAEEVEADLSALLEPGSTALYPQREALPFEAEDHHIEVSGQRVEALEALLAGRARVWSRRCGRSRSGSGFPVPWRTCGCGSKWASRSGPRNWPAARAWASSPPASWSRSGSTRRGAESSTSSASAPRTRSVSSSGATRSRPSAGSTSWTSGPRARWTAPTCCRSS